MPRVAEWPPWPAAMAVGQSGAGGGRAPATSAVAGLLGTRPSRGLGLFGEVVELAVDHAEPERLPFGRGEVELGAVGVLGVTDHVEPVVPGLVRGLGEDRKSTRLNSSHVK